MTLFTKRLRRKVGCVLSVAMVTLAPSFPASGQTEMTMMERYERFQLFANCEPMRILLEEIDSDATDIGLSKEAIVAAAESRLRSARIYSPDAKSCSQPEGSDQFSPAEATDCERKPST